MPPDPEDVARAIVYVEDSRRTHEEWLAHYEAWPDEEEIHGEIAGDASHHREAIARYDHVLHVLRQVET